MKKNNMRIPKIINYDPAKDPKRSREEPLMRLIDTPDKRKKTERRLTLKQINIIMGEIGKALKSIFDKLSDFFDIFDLSFFVSGVAITVSILFWLYQRALYNFQEIKQVIEIKGIVLLFILFCYINGLIAFAAGRLIRTEIWEYLKSKFFEHKNRNDSFDTRLAKIIKAHGLKNDLINEYIERAEFRGIWRLYVRLWAVVRGNKKYANSLSLLNRYWVMAATYDGLSIFLLIVTFIISDFGFGILGDKVIPGLWITFVIIIIVIFAFCACIREANRYLVYQVEELIATFAAGENDDLDCGRKIN